MHVWYVSGSSSAPLTLNRERNVQEAPEERTDDAGEKALVVDVYKLRLAPHRPLHHCLAECSPWRVLHGRHEGLAKLMDNRSRIGLYLSCSRLSWLKPLVEEEHV